VIASPAYGCGRSHAIKRNFPIVGRFRYWFEARRPPLRQYIVTGNDEERPFSRDQRRWVYASPRRRTTTSASAPTTTSSRPRLRHHPPRRLPASGPAPASPATTPTYALPCAKVLGGHRQRAKHAFRPTSIVNTSAMSYGSLSSAAVEAINRGVARSPARCRTPARAASPITTARAAT
jgi:hypothetical protein